MSNQPEARIVKKIMDYLEALPGCSAEKRHGSVYGKNGQPDISGCIRLSVYRKRYNRSWKFEFGQRLEIEVKVPNANAPKNLVDYPFSVAEARDMLSGKLKTIGNLPTELQVERLEEWEKAGALCAVVYSVEAVRALIMECQNNDL